MAFHADHGLKQTLKAVSFEILETNGSCTFCVASLWAERTTRPGKRASDRVVCDILCHSLGHRDQDEDEDEEEDGGEGDGDG